MIGICFYHEIVRPRAGAAAPVWVDMSQVWGLTDLFAVDRIGDLPAHGQPMPVASLADLIESLPEVTFVYTFPRASVPAGWTPTMLHDFTHPANNVIYVFGSNNTGIPPGQLSRQNDSSIVCIGTPTAPAGLWAQDCGLIVAYDRYLQRRRAH